MKCLHVSSHSSQFRHRLSSLRLKIKFALQQAMKAQRRRYSSSLSLTSALDEEWMVIATLRQLYSRERHPVPILWETGWVPGLAWTGAENLAIQTELSRPTSSLPFLSQFSISPLRCPLGKDLEIGHYRLFQSPSSLIKSDNLLM